MSIIIPSYVGFWPVREIAIDLIEPEQGTMLSRSKSSGAFPQPREAVGAVAVMAALFVFSVMPTPTLAGLAPGQGPGPGIEVAARPAGDIPTDERRGGKPSKLILRVQKALSDLGVYRGPLDGRMDVAIKSAIQAYQRGAGLKPDGRLVLVESLPDLLDLVGADEVAVRIRVVEPMEQGGLIEW